LPSQDRKIAASQSRWAKIGVLATAFFSAVTILLNPEQSNQLFGWLDGVLSAVFDLPEAIVDREGNTGHWLPRRNQLHGVASTLMWAAVVMLAVLLFLAAKRNPRLARLLKQSAMVTTGILGAVLAQYYGITTFWEQVCAIITTTTAIPLAYLSVNWAISEITYIWPPAEFDN